MKMTLRSLGVLATSALVLSACGGLGSTTAETASSSDPVPELADDENVSIVFESYNYGLAGAWTDTFNGLIDKFQTEHPNITVIAQKPQGNSPNPATDTISSIQRQTVAGTPPDIAQLGFSDLDFTINQLGARSLDDLFGKVEVPKNFDGTEHPYAPTARTLADWNGVTYGVPFVFSTPVFYYNATLFEQAGLDPADPPSTWDEVANAAKAIVASTGKGGVYLDCLTKSAKDWCYQSLVRSNGGRVISEDRSSLEFDGDAAVAATAMAQKLVADGATPVLSQQQGYGAFARGDMGMILETSAIQGTFIKGANGKWDLRATTMPSFGDKPTVPTNSGASLFTFAADPAKQRASWELMKFLTREESYIAISQGIGYLPLRTGLVDDPKALQQWAAASPLIGPNIEQLESMEPWVSMPGNNYLQIRDGMMDAVESIVYQGADPGSTLRAAQEQATSLLPVS
ncbi:ABC transporter substrate-binding protein [Rhodococcus erythropolis]|uniref:ABC transporter substrate-binding protein n=1 Tax=Rhodococcus erythropolis TaxID=1833 RepID=A0AAX3ZZT9_RHOER|nr:ABC transporter substrate-binding protein [Rhodococcus erythropolis]WMN01911.1 ABC transporter substrate-binding protein [Rhodococcus erythropolis]WMN03197.1 ABC transporter substrate-binding protein [Rhodococcus erythropolis]